MPPRPARALTRWRGSSSPTPSSRITGSSCSRSANRSPLETVPLEDRGRGFPGHLECPGLCPRGSRRAPGTRALHRSPRANRRRSGSRDPSRRLLLRRLPALRCHCPLRPGDGGGQRLRQSRWPGAGHLQWLSDPAGGPAAAWGAPAKRVLRVSMRMGPPPCRAEQLRLHARLPPRAGAAHPDLAWRGQLLRRCGDAGWARTQRAGGVSLLRIRRPGNRGVESQRFVAEHRGHLERARQCCRPDASSRTGLRDAARERGWVDSFSLGHPCAGPGGRLMAAVIDRSALAAVALTEEEYRAIVRAIGRDPNDLEVGMFGALWSEHCGYKTSKALLRQLTTEGPQVRQGPGENAGAVDIGDGLAVVFKIESHNHPSAIEPYQGAATGVGGILRDVFAMGARPIAILDALRFGPLDSGRGRHLFHGVVAGIGGYGNCFGCPTVGGEVHFDVGYTDNPIVNAMCVGLVATDRARRDPADRAGEVVLLVGADTGRDGIHGATFASVEMDERSAERRPAVQVGNPFLEKLLCEACLRLNELDGVTAIQDLGAAGLTSSASELAHRGRRGIDIDVDRVSRREQGMSAYDVMLSESQERMLIVVRPDAEASAREVFDHFELHADRIGTITGTGRIRVRERGALVADLPLKALVDGVPLRTPAAAFAEKRPAPVMTAGGEPQSVLLDLIASPNLRSRRPIYRTYDHQVQDNTVTGPGFDAALLRVPGTNKGLALTTDGNPRYVALDPYEGTQAAVAEAARNIVCTGARPIAVTNCLHFWNPHRT